MLHIYPEPDARIPPLLFFALSIRSAASKGFVGSHPAIYRRRNSFSTADSTRIIEFPNRFSDRVCHGWLPLWANCSYTVPKERQCDGERRWRPMHQHHLENALTGTATPSVSSAIIPLLGGFLWRSCSANHFLGNSLRRHGSCLRVALIDSVTVADSLTFIDLVPI
jgi:hypothetical protein